ncbi:MAG TPA: type II toxin-antitoxin system RelE/ParE family toxin [Longimicrobium sp.]|nr:type II toxin-antitoxin system RelE/ParE family toxin [Longimicrobium sp.]
MIVSFADQGTADLYDGIDSKAARRSCPAHLQRVALRKLTMMNRAVSLADLRHPPGNHLEALKGDRLGQHSIRMNEQYRICFVWTTEGPAAVHIVDYH